MHSRSKTQVKATVSKMMYKHLLHLYSNMNQPDFTHNLTSIILCVTFLRYKLS